MYLHVRIPIPPEDRPKFRFLWRNLAVDRSPGVYEFERVVFEDASAPFVRSTSTNEIDLCGSLLGFHEKQRQRNRLF